MSSNSSPLKLLSTDAWVTDLDTALFICPPPAIFVTPAVKPPDTPAIATFSRLSLVAVCSTALP